MSLGTFDADRAAAYDNRISRLAPGYETLHDQVVCLLGSMLGDQGLSDGAHVLSVGAGTGAELIRLGREHPSWRFTAVDPSEEMLALCRVGVQEAGLSERVTYLHGPAQALDPSSSFDAATSILVAHFIQDPDDRAAYFGRIAEVLSPGAPFILADLHQTTAGTFDALFDAWRRHLIWSGAPASKTETAFEDIRRGIHFATEAELAKTLTDAGFEPPTRFFQSYLWAGWYTSRCRM
ncbi:MAG: class I SAM-dependent methyltransferase [Bacteroidota bacterium]